MEDIQQLLKKYWAGTATESERDALLALLLKKGTDIQIVLENESAGDTPEKDVLLSDSRSATVLQKIHDRITQDGMPAKQADNAGKLVRTGIPADTGTRVGAGIRAAIGAAAEPAVGAGSPATAGTPVRTATPGRPATPVRKWDRPWLKPVSWAAAVILGIMLSMPFLSRHNTSKAPISRVAPAIAIAAPALKEVLNQGAGVKALVLEDGSAVTLYPGSALYYRPSFDSASRNITLRGKAVFKVARETARPFTVTADGISTTALGTQFSVSTLAADHRVQVRLLEGKVMIRAAGENGTVKDIYLSPGQECLVSRQGGAPLVRNFPAVKSGGAAILPGRPHPEDPLALEFFKEPLDNVFKKISKHYNITIICADKEIKRLSFTGRFLPTDSLDVILNVICNTNDLLFGQHDSLITIRKIK